MVNDIELYKSSPEYFHYYFNLINTNDIVDALVKSKNQTFDLFESINEEKENYSYGAGKWTTKEVIRHIIDTERIFAYRALRFSRFDKTELPGFDENAYVDSMKLIAQDFGALTEEYLIVRDSSISLFKSMTNEMLDFLGTANKVKVSTKAIGFMIAGHNLHHCNFLMEKYITEK